MYSNDITKDLLEPAIFGTTEILKAVKANAPTVKRVVITFEESQKDPVAGYYGSKKLAEKAAWDFIEAEKPAFEMTTLCPPMVYGPALQEVKSMSNLNASSTAFYALFSGQQKELKNAGVWLWTDVRDIAKAHIAALEKPRAGNERFLIREGRFSINYVVDFIWKHYPERAQAKGIPKPSQSVAFPETGTYHPDNSKSKNILGIEYFPIERTLVDTLEQFVVLEKELGVESSPSSERH
ncbi:unnamed protein product [Rhizoctonia solani]|uniref:NAD-dependent epimerase/dehydratase domain-containing protein n=1 Tax=Rhizoctonia solani TaxID=456999 RepID=A0A8H3BXX2_9AGAM|nr:unnamed protein product [Rhizoctonia solani]